MNKAEFVVDIGITLASNFHRTRLALAEYNETILLRVQRGRRKSGSRR